MSSYRVEVVSDNRKAGCQDTQCKKDGVKILKGELRLGTWVEMAQFSSAGWRWKHWGCVSGFQILNMRTHLEEHSNDSSYNWEYFDGLDDCPADIQEKVKTAVIEGKIADEDFKGDPEYNKLGQKGIRGRVKKVQVEENGDEADSSTPKPTLAKRGRAKKEENVDEAEVKPVKKRAKISKDEEDEEEEKNPVKKSRVKKAKKEEGEEEKEDEEEKKSAKKSRGKKVKKEEDEEEEDIKPVKKAAAKVKKEEASEGKVVKDEPNDDVNVDVKPAKKVRGKKALKKEDDEDIKGENGVKKEESDKDVKPSKKGRSKKAKKEEVDSEVDVKSVPTKKPPKSKAKKEEPITEDDDEEPELVPGMSNKVLKKQFNEERANGTYSGTWEEYVSQTKIDYGFEEENPKGGKKGGKGKKAAATGSRRSSRKTSS